MMKKTLLPLCFLILLSACGASGRVSNGDIFGRRNIELTIFADASLSDALEEIAGRYREASPWVRTRFLFASSGELSLRIRDGATCDIFLSASPAPMDALDGDFRGDLTRNPDGADLLLDESRMVFAENRAVLAVPVGNPNGIRGFAHMSAVIRRNSLLFATADPSDPLGVCAERVFDAYAIGESVLTSGFTFAADAKEVVTLIQSGLADGGILYRTDADGLLIVDASDAPVTYCGAVLSDSAAPLAASAFLEYLTGREASEILTRAGFGPLSWAADVPDLSQYGEYWEAALPDQPTGELSDTPSWA